MDTSQSVSTQNKIANSVSHAATGAMQARKLIEPGMGLSVRWATDATISPDGQRVAFLLSEFVADQPKERTRIWTVETSGRGEAQPLTKGPREDLFPSWSPDGTSLAYASAGAGEKDKPQLYIIPAQGGEAKQVCTMPNEVSNVAWSPDGSRIAFISLEGAEPQEDPLVVTPSRQRRLWTVRPGYDIPEAVTPDNLTVWEYAWSPDGKQIAVYYSTGPDETDWYNGQVGIVSANGGAVRQLSQLTGQASNLTWSPDGSRIAYVTGQWSDRGLVGGDVYVQAVEGGAGEARNLTPDSEISLSHVRWFPDGRRMLYAAWSGVTSQIGILDDSSGEMHALAPDFVIGEGFGPRFSATPDLRSIAVTHSTHDHPYDVWYGQLTGEHSDGIEWRRLTRLNPIAEETFALGPTKRIRYESVDGWQIDALLTLPPHTEGNTPLPLIVQVHGGPSAAYTDSWSSWGQLLASAGFAVLEPNIRGSQGRGTAFSNAVLGDMGGKDFQDIMRGMDYLIRQGVVDASRIGIMGWSYGGFMTTWALTQTDRFKAALMGAGLSDFHSFHAQSNIPDWDRRFIGADMLENPQAYRDRSAITYAARVTTPTLIVHGEKDECVPVNQAYAFYRTLRERGIPSELVIYPREGHGPREQKHLRDLEERMVRWFKQYL